MTNVITFEGKFAHHTFHHQRVVFLEKLINDGTTSPLVLTKGTETDFHFVSRQDGQSFEFIGHPRQFFHEVEVNYKTPETVYFTHDSLYITLTSDAQCGVRMDHSTNTPTLFGGKPYSVDYQYLYSDDQLVDVMTDPKLASEAEEMVDRIPKLRQVQPDRYDLTVVTCVRNEGIYLPHWIAYHRAMGVTKFVIFTNNNDDGSDDLLAELGSDEHILVVRNESESKKSVQKRALAKAFLLPTPYVRDSKWVLVMDTDEYLAFDHHYVQNLKNPADKYRVSPIMTVVNEICAMNHPDTVNAISLCWRFAKPEAPEDFSDITTPLPMRNPHDCSQIHIGDGYRLVKTLFRPDGVVGSTAHNPIFRENYFPKLVLTDGKDHEYRHNPVGYSNDPMFVDRLCTVRMSIVHFFSKSPVEFMVKTLRNRGNDPVSGQFTTANLREEWYRPVIGAHNSEGTERLQEIPYIGSVFKYFDNNKNVSCAWEECVYAYKDLLKRGIYFVANQNPTGSVLEALTSARKLGLSPQVHVTLSQKLEDAITRITFDPIIEKSSAYACRVINEMRKKCNTPDLSVRETYMEFFESGIQKDSLDTLAHWNEVIQF